MVYIRLALEERTRAASAQTQVVAGRQVGCKRLCPRCLHYLRYLRFLLSLPRLLWVAPRATPGVAGSTLAE